MASCGACMRIDILCGVILFASLIGHIVCFWIALVKVYQKDETLAVLFFIFNLACGLGTLMTFAYVWTRAAKWNLKRLMWVWSACLVILILLFTLDGSFQFMFPLRNQSIP